MNKIFTQDVFGIQRDLPLNYVERKQVDSLFIDSLSKQKHIVVYGSSKQGKTCLRKHGLVDQEYIEVHCSNRMGLPDINASILKAAGFEVTASTRQSVTGRSKVLASIKASLFGSGAELGTETEDSKTREIETKSLDLDIEDVNDVIQALKSINFDKFIILEDFHYLQHEVQKDFSVQLKAFHEKSKYCFVVVGVWVEENRLIVYNGDLTGRVVAVNADRWPIDSLLDVIERGERLLNIRFASPFREDVVNGCFGNVAILQEACYSACVKGKVMSTSNTEHIVGSGIDAAEAISNIVFQQSGRYNSFLTHFSSGFQDTELEMYKWLLYPILTAKIDHLRNGLKFSYIKQTLRRMHPLQTKLNTGNITQALQYTTQLQVKKGIKPIVIDYDQTDLRLDIVDRSFIIWLTYANKKEILELVDLPTEGF